MTKSIRRLDLHDHEDHEHIIFNLKCLEIAVQMLGPKPYDPKTQTGDDYFNQYLAMADIVGDRITQAEESYNH
jgi:hypothetical protein